ncbi:hypothetical protein QSE02_005332, partial [Escherichia coli]
KEYYLASLVAFALWKEAPDTIELFRTRINHAWHQKKQKDKYLRIFMKGDHSITSIEIG